GDAQSPPKRPRHTFNMLFRRRSSTHRILPLTAWNAGTALKVQNNRSRSPRRHAGRSTKPVKEEIATLPARNDGHAQTLRSQAAVPDNGERAMKIDNLQGLFHHTLKDIYFAEGLIVKSLPKMIRNTDSKALAKALDDHLLETKEHVKRLENVFEMIG